MPALEHFRGYIIEVTDGIVYAMVTDDGGIQEQLEFPATRIPPSERPLLRDGAPFTMSVFANRVRIRFRRLKWSAKRLQEAQAEGRELIALLRHSLQDSEV